MIRKATIKDIKNIHSLLHEYGRKGELLSRPLSQLYDHLRDFSVYLNTVDNEAQDTADNKAHGIVIGCCALQFCWEDLAEIRSLAVHPAHLQKNIGSKLVEHALYEARLFSITRVFTLTYRPDFFRKFDFRVIERSKLPLKIWGECLHCVKFPDCDETAMLKEIEY